MFSKSENTLRPLDEIVVEEFSHFADHLDALGQLQRDIRRRSVSASWWIMMIY